VKSSKLALSAAEWQMAASSEVILTKNKIIDNVFRMYGMLADDFKESSKLMHTQVSSVFDMHPKISKGENYEGMPWVMLDYPRHFSKVEGHFAIRCFFWWGHFFSISLQLSGHYLSQYNHVFEKLHQQHWYVGFTDDPWNQHLPNADWKQWQNDVPPNSMESGAYAKAAKKIPVTEWPQVQYFLKAQYHELIQALHNAI